jgi:glycerate dehydrogenase
MKIVVLDGYTLNPGDLSWEPLRALGTCTIHDRTPKEEILSRAAGAEILLTNKTLLTCPTIKALPSLRYIGVLATGSLPISSTSPTRWVITHRRSATADGHRAPISVSRMRR